MEKLQEAITLVEMGHVQEGIQLVEVLRKEADHQTLYDIARLYENWGHLDEALKIVTQLRALYPEEGDLTIFAAELLIEMEKEDEALEILGQISSCDESYVQSLLLQADLYFMQGLHEVAEQKLLKARKSNPEEPVLAYALGELYLERGDFLKAAAFFKEAEPIANTLPEGDLYLRLAESLSRGGKFEEALEYYKKGLEIKKELHSLFGYGLTAFKTGEFKTAITALTELKDLDPDYTTLYPLLSSAYEEEGALDEALEAVREGIAKDEFNEDLKVRAAKLLYRMGNPEEGERFARDVIALNPSNADAVLHLSSQLKKEERFDDIIELLTHVKEQGDETPEMAWDLAYAYKEAEEFEAARGQYESAYPNFKNHEVFLEEYGMFLIEEGEPEKASTVLKHALSLNPNLYHLEETISRLEEF
ncbi:tetratricopeptide repeat protein [Fictibacillus enclensis]|uniref:tetratricopeptide repeat protein n=1 Tax=Fictibacillus enclensis TaxID=1017270 RepID=UPI0025A160E7|nr:tetratricopeptide repeat protein [Fictibacillus enclensis]MDM5199510.1 tetratricopeptide repeat protein [Fictibacillus enclensis]